MCATLRFSELLACSAFLLATSPTLTLGAREVDWKDRLLSESISKAKDVRAKMSRVQGHYKCTTTVWEAGKKKVELSYSQWKQRVDAALYMYQVERAPEGVTRSGSVYGVNSRYRFVLSRREPNAPWVITSLELKGSAETKAEELTNSSSPYFFLERILNHGYSLFPHVAPIDPGATDLSRPEFLLNKVGAVQESDEELVKVEFEFKHPERPHWPLKSGWIMYDPQNHWVIRKYQLRRLVGSLGSVFDGAMRYETTNSGVPVIASETRESTTGEVRGRDEIEYQIEEADIPESEFTLTAFGLVEPFGVQSKSTPWHFWGAAAGIICIIAGVLLWRRYRRWA